MKPQGSYFSSPGFQVNSAVLQAIVSRYADAQYAIDFDSFVGCLIKLEMLFSKCHRTQHYHFSISHIDLWHIHIASVSFCSFYPEIFRTLKRADSGKIELDIQQVCKRITKAVGVSTLAVQTARCIIVFPFTVALPGDLLTLETGQERNPL